MGVEESESPDPKKKPGPMHDWLEKTGWGKRVKAVCRPCWEIKYSPYGPLVEEFPLPEQPDDRSCRIFGHHCPYRRTQYPPPLRRV